MAYPVMSVCVSMKLGGTIEEIEAVVAQLTKRGVVLNESTIKLTRKEEQVPRLETDGASSTSVCTVYDTIPAQYEVVYSVHDISLLIDGIPKDISCHVCKGSGTFMFKEFDSFETPSWKCPQCDGTGRINLSTKLK